MNPNPQPPGSASIRHRTNSSAGLKFTDNRRKAKTVEVRIASGAGETFGVDDIAVATAFSQGFWAREGLDVEWLPVRGGVKAVEAVLKGDADVAYGTFRSCRQLQLRQPK